MNILLDLATPYHERLQRSTVVSVDETQRLAVGRQQYQFAIGTEFKARPVAVSVRLQLECGKRALKKWQQ